MISGFAPIVTKDAKVLILGSMPSIVSLEKSEYYGFKQNRFWKVIATYFNTTLHNYEEKVKCIQANKIMLWDIIKVCERKGSLDANIKNEEVNDIAMLLKQYPSIQTIICNGKKSYILYQKYFAHLQIECLSLPSTSNANRMMDEKELMIQWHHALKKAFMK
ncbi:MAG: DNA-deoxyinosine glycosylase [Erysipelotrichia bacterium]|nr:DNA-deoxyinosine glycosylase [Erysipelotrichia bacterium]NCC54656.1 DNA-deoxyinosine glycosylase [Erysipelotrichia bacterium]